MPIQFLAGIAVYGVPDLITNHFWAGVKVVAGLVVLFLVKWIASGASNTSERNMHSKVVIITGGTSGVGAETARELAQRGAQVIILTHLPPSDIFLVDFIEDMRTQTGNELIYAEQCDLSSLYSVRQFATKWIDNSPPRRLDMIILCAATLTPPGKPRKLTKEGIEENWMVNYVANFHLLSILSPALRIQPPDRDVRVLMATCSAYIGSPPLTTFDDAMASPAWSPGAAYARSKLALMTFGQAYQKHLESYKRPDGSPMNTRVVFADPGYSRTPGMRRWLTRGSLWGLAIYVMSYLVSWLLLKSPVQGAQSILHAAMEASLGRGAGGRLIKECREMDFARADIHDEKVAKQLWEGSEKLIERIEREEAVRRAYDKVQSGDAKPSDKTTSTGNEQASTGTKSKSRRQRKAA